MSCKRCRSFAINHHLHARDGSEPYLCDVCFWRARADATTALANRMADVLSAIIEELADGDDINAQQIARAAGASTLAEWRELADGRVVR